MTAAESFPATGYGTRTGPRPLAPAPVERVVGASKQTVFMDEKPRCVGFNKGRPCNKLLAEFVARPWSIQCSRCSTRNVRNTPAA